MNGDDQYFCSEVVVAATETSSCDTVKCLTISCLEYKRGNCVKGELVWVDLDDDNGDEIGDGDDPSLPEIACACDAGMY